MSAMTTQRSRSLQSLMQQYAPGSIRRGMLAQNARPHGGSGDGRRLRHRTGRRCFDCARAFGVGRRSHSGQLPSPTGLMALSRERRGRRIAVDFSISPSTSSSMRRSRWPSPFISPLGNAMPAAVLRASFLTNAAAFFVFATVAAKLGLTTSARLHPLLSTMLLDWQRAETIAAFRAFCAIPFTCAPQACVQISRRRAGTRPALHPG